MIARIKNNQLAITNNTQLVQGTVGARIGVQFSSEWADLSKTAVFSAGDLKRDAIVCSDNITIPWELLAKDGHELSLSFHGALADGTIVLRTNIAQLGKIRPSYSPSGEEPEAPSPTRADQIQAIAEQAAEDVQKVLDCATAGLFDGKDGISPSVSVQSFEGGHRISIADAAGTKQFAVMDGAKGEKGDQGEKGEKGDPGPQGPKGDPGEVTQAAFNSLQDELRDFENATDLTRSSVFSLESTSVSYQWQYRIGTSGWSNSSNSTASSKDFIMDLKQWQDNYAFRCLVTDSAGESYPSNTTIVHVSDSERIVPCEPITHLVPGMNFLKNTPSDYYQVTGGTVRLSVEVLFVSGLSALLNQEIGSTEIWQEAVDRNRVDFRVGSATTYDGSFVTSSTRIASYNIIPIHSGLKASLTQEAISEGYSFSAAEFGPDGSFVKIGTWKNADYIYSRANGCYGIRFLLRKGNEAMSGYLDSIWDIIALYDVFDIRSTGSLVAHLSANRQASYAILGNFSELYQSESEPTIPDIGALTTSDIYSLYDAIDTSFMSSTKNLIGYATAADGSRNTALPIYEYIFAPRDTFHLVESPRPTVQPTFLLTSGVHAGTEKGAVYNLFCVVKEIVERSSVLADLISNFTFKVVPVVNPYALDNGLRVNARGVNLNRNFGFGWDKASSDSSSTEYRGEAPYSEQETQAVATWLNGNADALALVDCHNCFSNGQYGWMCSMPEEDLGIFSTYSRRLSDHWCDVWSIASNEALMYCSTGEAHPGPADECRIVGIPHHGCLECNATAVAGRHTKYGIDSVRFGKEIFANYILALAETVKLGR